MTDNVKSIFGGYLPNTPDENLIEALKGLLADAEAGSITGIVYSCHEDKNRIVFGSAGDDSFTMLAGLEMAKSHLVRRLDE